jgi:hypothetical protein
MEVQLKIFPSLRLCSLSTTAHCIPKLVWKTPIIPLPWPQLLHVKMCSGHSTLQCIRESMSPHFPLALMCKPGTRSPTQCRPLLRHHHHRHRTKGSSQVPLQAVSLVVYFFVVFLHSSLAVPVLDSRPTPPSLPTVVMPLRKSRLLLGCRSPSPLQALPNYQDPRYRTKSGRPRRPGKRQPYSSPPFPMGASLPPLSPWKIRPHRTLIRTVTKRFSSHTHESSQTQRSPLSRR